MLLMLFLLIFEVKARVNPFGPTVVGDFTNCVNELIQFNFNESGLIIFANTKNVSSSAARIRAELLKKINSKQKFSIQVKSPSKEPPLCMRDDEDMPKFVRDRFETIPLGDYFIVIVDTYKDFTQAASRMVRSRNWNPHAKIVVLFFHFSSTDQINERLVENMLTCMFKLNVINMVVIVPQAKSIRNAIVYSWRPYNPPKYCGYFNETATNRLLIENTCEQGDVKHPKRNIFADRIPASMEGCVLEILTLQRQPFISNNPNDPNIEKYFINELASIFNLRTEYKFAGANRGEKNPATGNWEGALNKLIAKEGYILLGGLFSDSDVHEEFECSSTYLSNSYTWVVPIAQQSPKFEALIIIFKESVWYCVIAVFFLCVLSWKVLGHLCKEKMYHTTLGHCFLNTWISHVGFCAYARPMKDSLRVFYVFFNLYCILFLTGYQTKLIDVLKNPLFEDQIDTIEELVQSGLKFGGFEELHDLYYNSSDPFDYMIGEKWIYVENITQALIDVSVYRNLSVLSSRFELAHLSATVPELSDGSGDYKYFAFERSSFTVALEMVSLRGFAFMPHFSKILERFTQMGTNEKVHKYFKQVNLRRRAKLLRELGEAAEVNPLTLQHLQGGFLALAAGYIGGILVLILEIIYNTKYVRTKINIFKANLKKRRKK